MVGFFIGYSKISANYTFYPLQFMFNQNQLFPITDLCLRRCLLAHFCQLFFCSINCEALRVKQILDYQ